MNNQAELTLANLNAMTAQAVLMNGNSQFSEAENKNAEQTLARLVIEERKQGNYRLEAIYQNALNQVRRGYR